jgi:hypothetical protein
MPNFGPGRTALLGLSYGSDAGGNSNWDKIDGLLGKLAGDAGLLPPDPATEAGRKKIEEERVRAEHEAERERKAAEAEAEKHRVEAEKHAKAEEHHAKG